MAAGIRITPLPMDPGLEISRTEFLFYIMDGDETTINLKSLITGTNWQKNFLLVSAFFFYAAYRGTQKKASSGL